jgi:hypothetical protein
MVHLVPQIAGELNWVTLHIVDSARRASNSKSSYTNITYVCSTKDQGIPIYLDIEQKRDIGLFIVERILQYDYRMYTKYRKQGLTPI